MTDKPLLPAVREVLERYRNETPLGHQPHMIAHEADDLLARLDALDGDALAKEIGREAVAQKYETYQSPDWNYSAECVRDGLGDNWPSVASSIRGARLTLARLGIGEQDAE